MRIVIRLTWFYAARWQVLMMRWRGSEQFRKLLERIWNLVRQSLYLKMATIWPNRREISLKNQLLLQLNTCHPVGTLRKWQTQHWFTFSICNKGDRWILNRQSYQNYSETGGTMLSLDQLSKDGRLDPPKTCFKWIVLNQKYDLWMFMVTVRLE